jgi:hypothetical protein
MYDYTLYSIIRKEKRKSSQEKENGNWQKEDRQARIVEEMLNISPYVIVETSYRAQRDRTKEEGGKQ